MKCRKVTHRYRSLRHVSTVENPSLPGPLSFSQNYASSHSLLRLGEGPALKSDLQRYVLENYSTQEILDFASRDYTEYAWSLPTLSRRLNFFGIKYIRYETSVEDDKKAIQEEMEGPGCRRPKCNKRS